MKIHRPVLRLIAGVFDALMACLLLAAAPFCGRRRKEAIVWGTDPLINIKYWSAAMKAGGIDSTTLVETVYPANDRSDFDVLFDDLMPGWVRPELLRRLIAPHAATLFIMRRAAMLVMPAKGAALSRRWIWRLEAVLFRLAGVRTVVVSYGSDIWMYSQVQDPSVLYGLLTHYPEAARGEREVTLRVRHWERHADVILASFLTYGRGRWDVTVPNMLAIDLKQWKRKRAYSSADGRNGAVRIVHTPNHRAFKGTEFLVAAVETLRGEGLSVELLMQEGVPNRVVRQRMQEADICADQFITTGYGLAAVEAMASGLPVICNLDREDRTRVFRRYAFLNECPIVSGPPERLADVLRRLVTEPELRAQLGQAGRRYAEKYHSPEAARYLFGLVYDRLVRGKDVDIMAPYHPLLSDYGREFGTIETPLTENRLQDTG